MVVSEDIPRDLLRLAAAKHVDEKLGKGYVWVDKLLMKPMARRDAWMSMFCQLYPAMKWGMVAVIMPVKTLDEKVGKLYCNMLPPLGVNKNIGKGWRTLPSKYQGLGLPNYTLGVLISKLNLLQKHWNLSTPPGEMLR